MTTEGPSLRERSKAKRRVAIQRAALRLMAEHGYDGATIAEIADEAEVAPRSVSMYFPSKLDMALSTSGDIAERLVEAFEANAGLDFVAVVDHWLRGERDATDPELAALTLAMFEANPDLRAVSTRHFADAARVGGAALLTQLGLAADDPMLPVVTATVGAAVSAYLTTTLQTRSNEQTHEFFMRYLRAVIDAAAPA